MSEGVWNCENCGYSVGASWGQTSWTCPRCKGKKDFVENLQDENDKLKKKIVKLEKKILELEEKIHPSHLGLDI